MNGCTAKRMSEQSTLHSGTICASLLCFENEVNPNDYYKNEPLIYELTSEYMRSSRFKDCVKAFVEYGLNFEDKILLSVLLDDAKSLDDQLSNNHEAISRKYTIRCA